MNITQQLAVYDFTSLHFYTKTFKTFKTIKTIKSNIGLRGFTLQLKVEKAANLDDLRQLRNPYVEAVLKAKGRDKAALLAQQLDQLLRTSLPD